MRTEVWTLGDLTEVFHIWPGPNAPVKTWSSQIGNDTISYNTCQREIAWLIQAGWTLVSIDGVPV